MSSRNRYLAIVGVNLSGVTVGMAWVARAICHQIETLVASKGGVGTVKSYSMSNGNSKNPILAQKSEKLRG